MTMSSIMMTGGGATEEHASNSSSNDIELSSLPGGCNDGGIGNGNGINGINNSINNNNNNNDALEGVALMDSNNSSNNSNSNNNNNNNEMDKNGENHHDHDNNNNSNSNNSNSSTDHLSSNTQVAFNIIISFVGAGLLGMPYAFRQSGWMLGSIALSIVSAANVYSMLNLVVVRQRLQEEGHKDLIGYGDVGRVVMGTRGETVVNACLVISQLGFATAYIIFIVANVASLHPEIPSVAVCFGCIPILSVLVQAKEMKTLSPFSLLADVANLAGLSAVLFQDYEHYQHNDDIHTFEWKNLYYVIAISVYSLEGVGLILPLESSCQNRNSFPSLLKSVIFGITILCCLFGTAGYLAFGDQTMAPITLNLSHAGGEFVKIALALALYFTYPIMMFPIHSVLEGRLSSTTTSGPNARRMLGMPTPVIIRTLLVVLTAIIAYVIPDFGKFLSLVGSSICTLLGFVFPCYFHLATFDLEELPWWQSLLDILLIIGGVVFGIIGTFHSFIDLFDTDDNDGGGGGD
eukprot:CAMPEP_0119015182 /NCGR_PEP_ID=MMETSP1176-20130426/10602_1 /TAXON_ID=265551 /ORGANISM="Synedropsis recta cf, Strain CCMP1620" /LENGTH=517 /DNA_ID=CAMNT_0006968451 /DNA_START=36 /DNA_END=1589 /DNA_ORIENTATION=+